MDDRNESEEDEDEDELPLSAAASARARKADRERLDAQDQRIMELEAARVERVKAPATLDELTQEDLG